MLNSAATGLSGGVLHWTPQIHTATVAAGLVTWLPGELFDGWAEDGTTITIPLASLASNHLTAELADAISGDARQVAASLCGRMFEYFNELTDKPGAVTAVLRGRSVQGAGDFAGKLPLTYEFTFQTVQPEGTIAAEPD